MINELVNRHACIFADRKRRVVGELDVDRAGFGSLDHVALINRGADSGSHFRAIGMDDEGIAYFLCDPSGGAGVIGTLP